MCVSTQSQRPEPKLNVNHQQHLVDREEEAYNKACWMLNDMWESEEDWMRCFCTPMGACLCAQCNGKSSECMHMHINRRLTRIIIQTFRPHVLWLIAWGHVVNFTRPVGHAHTLSNGLHLYKSSKMLDPVYVVTNKCLYIVLSIRIYHSNGNARTHAHEHTNPYNRQRCESFHVWSVDKASESQLGIYR